MAPKGLIDSLRDQWIEIPDYVADLTGKTVIVVGANVGLGYEAAKKFAKMNPKKLILACRNRARGEEAAKYIQASTGNSNVECWTVDLADFKSISAFVDRYEKEGGGGLDVLLENAGILNTEFIRTIDGWENTLQVNHLGTALLALLLLPTLASTSGSPRITVVSSDMHYWVKDMPEAKSKNILNKLNDPTGMNAQKNVERYNVTKLFNVLFARSLAAHLKPSLHIAVNSMNPGFCFSSLRRRFPWPFTMVDSLLELLLARTTEVGSRTLVHAALWGSKDDVNGNFLSNSRVEEESDYSLSKKGRELEARVWKETLEVLKEADPRVKSIIADYLQ